MKTKLALVVLALVAVSSIMVGGLFADTPAPIPGITGPDAHPNGCVDCHAVQGGKDYRLPQGLLAMKGVKHPDITKIVKKVPDGCMMCHKAGAKMGNIDVVLHKAHFENPTTNHFVAFYQGSCLSCHKIDTTTGIMAVKSAAANW